MLDFHRLMSFLPKTFFFALNDSVKDCAHVHYEQKQRNSWFDLPTAWNVSLSLVLITNIWIGLVGKYAVLKRITLTGICAYPLNPLMFYHEIIYTVFRVSIMFTVLLLLVFGISAERIANWISQGVTGVDTMFCSWFYTFIVFAKTSDVLGSWAVAIFR